MLAGRRTQERITNQWSLKHVSFGRLTECLRTDSGPHAALRSGGLVRKPNGSGVRPTQLRIRFRADSSAWIGLAVEVCARVLRHRGRDVLVEEISTASRTDPELMRRRDELEVSVNAPREARPQPGCSKSGRSCSTRSASSLTLSRATTAAPTTSTSRAGASSQIRCRLRHSCASTRVGE